MKEEVLNKTLKEIIDSGEIENVSDGDHTFSELYDHRTILLALLANVVSNWETEIYKTTKHFDEDEFPMPEGYFLVSIMTPEGPITYHVQNKYWDLFRINVYDKATEWDGADSEECLRRLKNWCSEI